MSERTCLGCGADISHMAESAKFCSHRCGNRVRSQRTRDRSPGRRGACRRCGAEWYYRSLGGKGTPLCPTCSAEFKWCYACKLPVAREQFSRDSSTRDGLDARCRACSAGYDAGEFPRRRRYMGKRMTRYGISHDQYLALVAERDGCCEICGEAAELHVDHCHETGRVRGLLCGHCNRGIGSLRDDTARLRRAIAYLERTDIDLREGAS